MKGDIVSVEGIPVTLKEFCSQVAKLSQHYDINWTDFQSADTELKAVDIPTAIQVWSVNTQSYMNFKNLRNIPSCIKVYCLLLPKDNCIGVIGSPTKVF